MIQSTVTARSQTTIPTGVRKALGIEPGDKVGYVIKGATAVMTRLDQDESDGGDPKLAAFVALLARDIEARPGRLKVIPRTLVARIRRLTAGVDVDLDEAIEGKVDL